MSIMDTGSSMLCDAGSNSHPVPTVEGSNKKRNGRDTIRRGVYDLETAWYKHDHVTNEQARLMVLEPSQDPEAHLRATLITIPIDQLHIYAYTALSYHWGESAVDNPIFINSQPVATDRGTGHLGKIEAGFASRLNIKGNLYDALRHLRERDNATLLWVDGICIDQQNEAEKGAQVPGMAKIYSCAAQVCVWLGSADRDGRTDRAMDFISRVVSAYDIDTLIRKEEANNWSDLLFLMRSSWFSRRWVIQELALAKEATIRCGSKEVDWRDFSDAISLFDLNFPKIRLLLSDRPGDYYAITELRPLGAKILVDVLSNTFFRSADRSLFEPAKSLETLVSSLPTFETTDPRDTVYAFLNIAKDTFPKFAPGLAPAGTSIPPLTSDYGHGLLTVYINFVRYVVASSKSLDIICRQWALPEKQDTALIDRSPRGLPSWIKTIPESPYGPPSEGLNGRKNGDSFAGLPDTKIYNASRGKWPEIRFGSDSPISNDDCNSPILPDTPISSSPTSPIEEHHIPNYLNNRDPSLYVKGFVLGTVSWKTDPIQDGIIPQVALERLGWPRAEGKIESHSVPDQVWRTLVADRGPDGRPPPSWYHRACLRCLVHDTPNGYMATKNILEQRPSGIVNDYIKRVQAVTWNRVVLEATDASSHHGETLVGVGPPRMERGDLICILFGCSVPCIIRPWVFADVDSTPSTKRRKPDIGEQADCYEFVGEAFVYGKMDGQAIESMSPEDVHARTHEFRLL
ncbi:heterokaryon incompatibility protein-domain-containing protein [Hypoxylon sp. FL1150]|nr:heterokaryon incompatibility protein-domain-containing protein [Hypoxylon sp. FL1150]